MKRNFIILRSIEQPATRSGSAGFGFKPPVFRGSDNGPKKPYRAGEKNDKGAPPKIKLEFDQLDSKKIERLKAKKEILSIVPAMPMKLIQPLKGAMPAKKEALPYSWGVEATGAVNSQFNGDGIVVAVLDTGINESHPAFKGVKLQTKDFTGEGIADTIGHGTHCAGTIFGRDVNGTRIGIAPGIKKAIIGKVLGKNGGGSDMIADAINWAINSGADIISMSLGIDFPGYVKEMVAQGMPSDLATSKALEGYRENVQLFENLAGYINSLAAFKKSSLLIAAAGNESRREKGEDYVIAVSPPAIANGFISVGALGLNNKLFSIADFSNTGPQLCGPGVDIISADLKTGLTSMSGTSMATPHVAGIAALWGEKLMKAGKQNLKDLSLELLANASLKNLAKGYDAPSVGRGMVQAP